MGTAGLSGLLTERSAGFLELGGARMALMDIRDGFWGIRRQIEALIGSQLASAVLQQAGANGGASFARSFAKNAEISSSAAFTACVHAYQIAGFGRFEIIAMDWENNRISIRAAETFEAWMHLQHAAETVVPVCAYSAGVFVGFINVLSRKQEMVCVEHTCRARGDTACTFELLPGNQAHGQAVISHTPDPGLGRQLNLLELLFERMPMGIAIFDLDHRLVRSNQTWAEFIERYTPSDLSDVRPGARLADLAPGADEFFEPYFRRVFAGETIRIDAFKSVSGGIVSYWDVVFSPVTEDGKIVGVLDVTTDVTERVLLQHNLEKRVEERTGELERRKEIAESMSGIIAAINSSRSLDSTLVFIADQARHVMGSSACLVHHIVEERNFVSIEASSGLPEDLREIRGFPLHSSSSSDERILNRQPVWTSDFRNLPTLNEEYPAALHPDVRVWRERTGQHYRAWLAVPLVVAEKVYGSLAFYFAAPRRFTDEEISLSQSFADQAALAIENARLFEKAEQAAVVAERNRLARDLHDAVTQTLFSASMIADVLPKIWERSPEQGRQHLEELRQLTRGALSEMRTLLVELRPAALADTDLGDLIGHQVNAFVARTRADVEYAPECSHNPPPEVKEACYRIAQEAFNNIAKHADASRVTVTLACHLEGLVLIIEDNGAGFDRQAGVREGLGLSIMDERARSVGADLEINSRIRQGTRLQLAWQGPGSKESDRE